MSVIDGIPLLLGGEGYDISRSVRLRSSASAYFNRTPGIQGDRRTWTWSGWVKRGSLGSDQVIMSAGTNGNSTNLAFFSFNSSDAIQFYLDTGAASYSIITTQVFRDPSAWYHIVVVLDTPQATASNRMKLYVNGSQVTAFSTANYTPQNNTYGINDTLAHNLGRYVFNNTRYFDGYMTEINLIDGQAMTPSSFGETDAITGVWKPKKYAGTYGTNGFYLNFSDNSSNTATTIGKDYSGNGNNWTPNNISVTAGSTYDSMLDVPTLWADGGNGRGNYAVLNPLNANSGTISNGNLSQLYASASYQTAIATFGMSSGKWYCEITCTAIGGTGDGVIGIAALQPISTFTGNTATSYGWYSKGSKYNNGTGVSYNGGATWTTNSVIGVAFDADAGTLTFYKDGVSQGDAYTGIPASTYFIAVSSYSSTTYACNFGQRPFTYTPPTGFKALNTQNLPEPTIKKGASYFDISTWTGDQSARTITNSGGMQPDFLWTKSRSAAEDHRLSDSVRGGNGTVLGTLASNTTGAEAFDTDVTGFTSSGFNIRAGTNSPNVTGRTYVGWQWQAGKGVTSSNTNGTITSTTSVSTTAGFSVVTYTGNGVSNATVGHGLGVTPSMVIVKNRGSATDGNWRVKTTSLSSGFNLALNTTDAQFNASTSTNGGIGNLTSSTTFTLMTGSSTNNNVNQNTVAYVAYCFAQVAGYSAFGSYTGNGSADGPFIYTGFLPRWVMIKRTDSTSAWLVIDTTRQTYNVQGPYLVPNASDAETTGTTVLDVVSNGFKSRSSSTLNTSSGSYIYAAFAENPFKLSLAR